MEGRQCGNLADHNCSTEEMARGSTRPRELVPPQKDRGNSREIHTEVRTALLNGRARVDHCRDSRGTRSRARTNCSTEEMARGSILELEPPCLMAERVSITVESPEGPVIEFEPHP